METAGQPLPPFLRLPLELREQIYLYLLPSTNLNTRTYRGGRTIWIPGNTSLLSVSHQVHAECAELVYGQNIFELNVGYDHVEFIQLRRLKSGVMPLSNPPFVEFFPERNVRRMKSVVVNLQYIDDYTGMIKHNVSSSAGLMFGISQQVAKLVKALLMADELYSVQVNLRNWDDKIETARTVLDPLKKLVNVRDEIEVFGLPRSDADQKARCKNEIEFWRTKRYTFKPGMKGEIGRIKIKVADGLPKWIAKDD